MRKIIERELAFFARHLIRRFRPLIIGITGSSGKTTTKYFVTQLLRASTNSVYSAPGNLNSEIGMPLAILGYQNSPSGFWGWLRVFLFIPIKAIFTFRYEKYLILEYAADHPGDIKKLINIARPDITIITNIDQAHIEVFGSQENIIKEKWYLAQAAREAAIINKATLEKVKDLKKIEVDLYILPSIKYAKAENIEIRSNKTVFDLYIANKKYESEFKYFGQHNIDNLELAVYCAHLIRAEDDKIISAVKSLSPLAGRGRRFFINNDILIIDESYNANPASMKAALDNLRNIKYGRKVAILGQMAEIGPIAESSHREIAELAKKISDFTVGLGEPFKNLGLDRWYEDVSELIKDKDSFLKKGDVVLVKGSRWANRLDLFVKYLEKNDSNII